MQDTTLMCMTTASLATFFFFFLLLGSDASLAFKMWCILLDRAEETDTWCYTLLKDELCVCVCVCIFASFSVH